MKPSKWIAVSLKVLGIGFVSGTLLMLAQEAVEYSLGESWRTLALSIASATAAAGVIYLRWLRIKAIEAVDRRPIILGLAPTTTENAVYADS